MARNTLLKSGFFSGACLLVMSTAAIAQDKHVHGSWEAFAAREAGKLTLTLTGPLVDVLGYEHAPKTEAEDKVFHAFEKSFGAGQTLLLPAAAAACKLDDKAKIIWPKGYEHDDHDDHDGDHEHDDDHEHDHDDHDGDHDHENEHQAANVDVTLNWTCGKIDALTSIDFALFAAYPAIKQIDAVYLSDMGQKAARLVPQNKVFDLK